MRGSAGAAKENVEHDRTEDPTPPRPSRGSPSSASPAASRARGRRELLAQPARRRGVDRLLRRGGAGRGRGRPALLADPRYVRAGGIARRMRTSSTPAFFGITPARGRGDGPAAPASSWSAPGRRWSTPATIPARPPGRIGVWAGSGASTYLSRTCCRSAGAARVRGRAPGAASATTRTSSPRRASYELDLRARASRCRPPARPRWSPCTWPCQSLLERRVRHGAGRRRLDQRCRCARATSTRTGA